MNSENERMQKRTPCSTTQISHHLCPPWIRSKIHSWLHFATSNRLVGLEQLNGAIRASYLRIHTEPIYEQTQTPIAYRMLEPEWGCCIAKDRFCWVSIEFAAHGMKHPYLWTVEATIQGSFLEGGLYTVEATLQGSSIIWESTQRLYMNKRKHQSHIECVEATLQGSSKLNFEDRNGNKKIISICMG